MKKTIISRVNATYDEKIEPLVQELRNLMKDPNLKDGEWEKTINELAKRHHTSRSTIHRYKKELKDGNDPCFKYYVSPGPKKTTLLMEDEFRQYLTENPELRRKYLNRNGEFVRQRAEHHGASIHTARRSFCRVMKEFL